MASVDLDSVSDRDIIIAVMGATGVGKSSFINLAIGNDRTTVGHDLLSCTQEVRAVRCNDPNNPSRKFVFLDTPGFDDTHKSDTQTLRDIAEWLQKTYQRGIMLSGLLFLHRISDKRMAGTSLRNMHMFETLCGIGALQNVILVTTMWSEVDKRDGSAREKALRAEFWKSMIASGSRMARFDHTHESAWAILGQFDGVPRPLRLQVELVDEGKSLGRTAAGLVLMQWLEQLIAQFRTAIITLRPKGSKIGRELRRDELAAQQGLSRITEEIHSLDSERLVAKTVDAQGLADADDRKATAVSQPGVVTETRAQETPAQKRQPVQFPGKAQPRLEENEIPQAAELHAEKLALRGEIWENQRRSAEEAERKALEERRVADIRRTRTQEKFEQKRHTEKKEHERLEEAERRRAEKRLAEKPSSQENLRESQNRNAEEAERIALEERRVEDNRRAEERRLELKRRSGQKALEQTPTTKSAWKVLGDEKHSHNDTDPVELADFARKSFEIIALWKRQKCFDDPLVEAKVARIVKQGPGYKCAMQKSAKTAQEGCFFGGVAIDFCQRLVNAKDPLEFFKSALDDIRGVAKNAHHDSHDTHQQFEWIRIELVKISKELHSSRVGRRADWDVLSQFESAINDLNTLIKHINLFVDWWGNMTTRLANLEETLPQVEVDENTTFRTDTFKERWMEVRGKYMSYQRQISEVEGYCIDLIGDLMPSSTAVEGLSADKTAAARLVAERQQYLDEKRRSEEKQIAEEKRLKAEIETARLSEEKRSRREEEKRKSEAEAMRITEKRNAEIENVRLREAAKQMAERLESEEAEQERAERGEVEERRRAEIEIEAKRLLDEAKQNMEAVWRAFEEARQKYERKEASGVDTGDARQDHGGSAGHKSYYRHQHPRAVPEEERREEIIQTSKASDLSLNVMGSQPESNEPGFLTGLDISQQRPFQSFQCLSPEPESKNATSKAREAVDLTNDEHPRKPDPPSNVLDNGADVNPQGPCEHTHNEDETFEAESVTVWPKNGMVPSVPPPLTSDDLVRLKNQWEGGCVFSVHDSSLADDWLNHHYEHECLVDLRAHQIGGPVPSMLSVDAPALSIFGLISPQVIDMAGELAKLSGFPVMIRPATEDPSPTFEYHKSSNPDGKTSASQMNGKNNARAKGNHGSSRHGTSTRNKRPSGGDDHPNEQPEDDDDRSHLPDPSSVSGPSSAADPSSAPGPLPAPGADLQDREITHDTDICLEILVDGKDKEDFLHLQTSVKFHPIPNEKELPDSSKSKPKIEAHVVRLKMLRSPSIEIDSAMGSLGFLTDNEPFLRFGDFVSLGQDEAPLKHTFIENKQQTKATNLIAGVAGGKPTVTGGLTYTKVDSATTQTAEDTPSPLWVVKHEATKQTCNQYNTLNAKKYRSPVANCYQDMDLDAKYGMLAEVAYPIQKHAPKVSFVYRHQIHCWVAVESKARRRGIIVVAANYIPDICTEQPLWIREYPKLNLVHNCLEGNIPEGDVSPRLDKTSEGIFSFGTAITSKTPTQISQRFWSFMQKMMPILQKPQEKIVQDVPVHTHVRRGWDHTNLKWQNVVWPKLDCNLQPLQGKSTAAWRLDWQGGGKAENTITSDHQGIRTCTASSIEDPEASIKSDKGKAREVAPDA